MESLLFLIVRVCCVCNQMMNVASIWVNDVSHFLNEQQSLTSVTSLSLKELKNTTPIQPMSLQK